MTRVVAVLALAVLAVLAVRHWLSWDRPIMDEAYAIQVDPYPISRLNSPSVTVNG